MDVDVDVATLVAPEVQRAVPGSVLWDNTLLKGPLSSLSLESRGPTTERLRRCE
jgi:hypothetical protein